MSLILETLQANINTVIDVGLNTVCFNIPIRFENSTKNFLFENDCFYSYNEQIAEKVLKDDGILHIKVNNKTAQFNNFYSQTTSCHISKLLNAIKNHEHFKDHWNWIDNNGNDLGGIKKYKGHKVKCDFDCPICLEPQTNGLGLKCNHNFCRKCIRQWLKDHSECPYCKSSVFCE